MANATSNLFQNLHGPGRTDLNPSSAAAPIDGPVLEVCLDTTAPTLNVDIKEAGGLGTIRDVTIDGHSVVDHKIAQIELGDGLESEGKIIRLSPSARLQFVVIPDAAGQLDPDVLEILQSNSINQLTYNNAIYRLVMQNGSVRTYFTTDPNAVYNNINVNMSTGVYEVVGAVPVQLQQHIDNTVVHITNAERVYWNNKVSAEAELDAETGDHTLKLNK